MRQIVNLLSPLFVWVGSYREQWTGNTPPLIGEAGSAPVRTIQNLAVYKAASETVALYAVVVFF